jgi:hypothetical protein
VTSGDEPTGSLPPNFEALAPFVADWAIPTLEGRVKARSEQSSAGRAAFFAAGARLLEPALAYLDTRPRELSDAADARLMDLTLSLAHVALAEEVQGDDEPVHAELRSFMPITRTYPHIPTEARSKKFANSGNAS